jgi:hypothetical protein
LLTSSAVTVPASATASVTASSTATIVEIADDPQPIPL